MMRNSSLPTHRCSSPLLLNRSMHIFLATSYGLHISVQVVVMMPNMRLKGSAEDRVNGCMD
jgi:hypothetical protein